MLTSLYTSSHLGRGSLDLKLLFSSLVLTALVVASAAQNVKPANVKTVAATTSIQKEQSRQKFVLDVVHSAVGLPQSDPQDRLRVLYAAANLVSPIDQKLTRQFAKEGTAIETKLVAEGQKPAVSMLAGGHVDCASAAT